MAKYPIKILAALTILAMLLVACGGTEEFGGATDAATGDFENVAVEAPGPPTEGGDVVQDDGGRSGITPSNQVITPPGRDIIFTAQM
ncbi:MAG: hypothetical protein OEO77_06610, partial [Acidimicrobiia bacterium]|nr:hypothetical protein [Acidimicrobiia bacterium]